MLEIRINAAPCSPSPSKFPRHPGYSTEMAGRQVTDGWPHRRHRCRRRPPGRTRSRAVPGRIWRNTSKAGFANQGASVRGIACAILARSIGSGLSGAVHLATCSCSISSALYGRRIDEDSYDMISTRSRFITSVGLQVTEQSVSLDLDPWGRSGVEFPMPILPGCKRRGTTGSTPSAAAFSFGCVRIFWIPCFAGSSGRQTGGFHREGSRP